MLKKNYLIDDNHYYNNLRLIKLSKLSKKNFYQNFDQ